MSWTVIEKGRLYCILRNHSRSIPRSNVILKCFESSDEGKQERVMEHRKKQGKNFKERRKWLNGFDNNDAVKTFKAVAGKRKVEVEKEFGKEKFNGDYKIKLNSLVSKVDEFKTHPEKIKVNVAVKPVKSYKIAKATESEKAKFFKISKLVAQELEIDVTKTQEELYERFSSSKEDEGYFGQDGDELKSWEEWRESVPWAEKGTPRHIVRGIADSGDLGIFNLSPEEKRERMKLQQIQKEEGVEGEEGIEGIERMGRIEGAEEEAEVGEVDIVGREVKLEVWEALTELERYEITCQIPKNYFDELLVMTKLGLLHRFPIDNEQDWHEEHDTDFTEHVFLEKYLDPWCPQTGPLRHFMELITTGLSKNPYISVKKKKEHIMWYRDYFISKSSLLREVGLKLNVDEESKTSEGQSQNDRK